MFTWENTWKDIEDSGTTVAVVPVGSTEQHGTNLPLASDSLNTMRLAEVLSQELGAYLVPVIPIGMSNEHMSFRGTVSLSPDTLKAVIEDITDSLVKTGFETVIIVTMHGGNIILREGSGFITDLSRKYPGKMVLVVQLQSAFEEAFKAAGFTTDGMHADECEVSLIASLRPDLVGPNPVDFPDPSQRIRGTRVDSFNFPVDVREVSPSGSLGEPSKGSREKGDIFWDSFLKLVLEDVRKQAGL